jgi:hypothetical protein
MNFPLHLRFRIVTLSSKIDVTDAAGQLVCTVRKKMFKLKEHIEVFADEKMTSLLLEIRADRVLDFSAVYVFSTPDGRKLGSVSRKGMRSIWRAHYLVADEQDRTELEITEENPWVKLLDGLFDAIPILGGLTGFLFNPAYLVRRPGPDGEVVFRVKKEPALFEGLYTLSKTGDAGEATVSRVISSVLMMVLLERYRG